MKSPLPMGIIFIALISTSCTLEDITPCTPNKYDCQERENGFILSFCNKEGMWDRGKDEICMNGCSRGFCESDTTDQPCTPDETKCIDKTVVWCTPNHNWTAIQRCDGVCNNGKCESNIECIEGENYCTNDVYRVCHDGTWLYDYCFNGCDVKTNQCISSNSSDDVCICPESQICIDNICIDITKVPEPECTNGDIKCDDINLMVCKDGAWQIHEKCSSSQTCQDGRCIDNIKEPDPECEEGVKQCDSINAMVCQNGTWRIQEICSNSQTCQNGSCIAKPSTSDSTKCANGKSKCSAGMVSICTNNHWGVAVPCKGTCQADGCFIQTSDTDEDKNHNHISDKDEKSELFPEQSTIGKSCLIDSDCGLGDDVFCDSLTNYTCARKCRAHSNCLKDDYCGPEGCLCRIGDGRCASQKFITIWDVKTDQYTKEPTITLTNQYDNDHNCDGSIDWGDGSIENLNKTTCKHLYHVYREEGEYKVTITGNIDGLKNLNNHYNNTTHLKEVVQFGLVGLGEGALNRVEKIGNVDIPDASKLTTLKSMFEETKGNSPLEQWDIRNVTTMERAFFKAENFNQPLNRWDTRNVENMEFTFAKAEQFNQPLGDWNTSNVATMNSIFYRATNFNQPIGKWNTSNVIDMDGAFYGALAFNQDISDWDVSAVQSMYMMFCYTQAFLWDLSKWDLSGISSENAIQNIFLYSAYHFSPSILCNMAKNNSGWKKYIEVLGVPVEC